LAHARLAEAWWELDYADKAKDELLRVHSLTPSGSRVAESDALYVDAINATVSRNFPGAIAAYSKLAQLSPNEPQVFVDLGRAYEKNEAPSKAIESFLQATQRDPQYATAFLRMGSLYARQLDQANALSEVFSSTSSANYPKLASTWGERSNSPRLLTTITSRPKPFRNLGTPKLTQTTYLKGVSLCSMP
jgi:tetratricopeptide (TPR) repeat protein